MKNKFSILTTLAILGLITYIIYQHVNKPKTGYIYITEIYNGFDMKKQMEQKYLKTKQARDKILDSLKFDLNSLLKQIDSEKEKVPATIRTFELKREEFMQKKNSFEEENTALTQQYDKEILTQLNQYVKEYGSRNKYTILFGNDGNGSLMYATDELNKTKEVLDFVNNKYNGLE